MSNQIAVIPVSDIERMAVAVAKSGLFGVSTPDQALALMLVAQAEGRHPASAAKEYHIIKGRPALKADAMLARFQQAGGKVAWNDRSNDKVSATFSHEQGGELVVTWTLDDAKRAGLASGDNWKKYPRQMLSARVISEGVRAVYPSVVSGIYTPEEVQDFEPTEPIKATPVIAKPVFKKKEQEVEDPEVIEAEILAAEVNSQVNPREDLFRLMNQYGITEEDIILFCEAKGMINVPESVSKFSDKLSERLVNIFEDGILKSIKK